ncbi:unnamed protein product [Effrenium voratum]|uniref:Uncharacterized protein n=1 Tax=Effrenium voratum TaxID=2562239 RepID=A0AA36MP97_9DINO|nr:unnamed protein product [Effrenium voratum]
MATLRASKSGSLAEKGPFGRLAKTKTCVCAASASLGRERSRLLKLEQRCLQRTLRIVEKEEAVEDLENEVEARERELAEKRDAFLLEEQQVAQNLEALQKSTREAQQLQASLAERQQEVLQRQKVQQKQRQKLTKRLQRAEATEEHLKEERKNLEHMEVAEPGEPDAQEAELLRQKTAARRAAVGEAQEQLEELRKELQAWQAKLEPVRRELQMKEADLDERRIFMERSKEELNLREQRHLEQRAMREAELEKVAAAKLQTASLEKQLEELWDEIHQRRQILQDLLAQRRDAEDAAGELRRSEVEDLRSAELAERAWRERCTSLVARRRELLAEIQHAERAADKAAEAAPEVPSL